MIFPGQKGRFGKNINSQPDQDDYDISNNKQAQTVTYHTKKLDEEDKEKDSNETPNSKLHLRLSGHAKRVTID